MDSRARASGYGGALFAVLLMTVQQARAGSGLGFVLPAGFLGSSEPDPVRSGSRLFRRTFFTAAVLAEIDRLDHGSSFPTMVAGWRA